MATFPIVEKNPVNIDSAVQSGGLTIPGQYPTLPSAANTALTAGQFNNSAPLPTSVVSSNRAVNTANNIKTNIIAPYNNAIANQQPSPTNNVRDANGLLMNPPGAKFDRNTGKLLNTPTQTTPAPVDTNPLETAQTNQILHPGQTQLYNTRTGEQEWVDNSNGTPPGYSNTNPKTRTDVTDSVQDADGTTIDKLSDGTYRRVDINGNYTIGTSAMFSNAQRVNTLSTALDDLRNGIFTPTQQTQLNGIESDYKKLIDKQSIENDNITGGTAIAQNRNGLSNQIIGKQLIDKTVNDGIERISALNSDKNTAIAKMKQALDQEDTDALKSAYDIYNTSSQNVQKEIDKTQAVIKASVDKQDLANRSNAITMANKYIDVTDPILSSDTPEQVREKVKTSPTWQAEQKQKSGLVDEQAVDGAYAIWQKTQQLPTGFSAMSQNLKNAIYKKIGGNPDSVDQAVVNKAILTGKTKALTTQENQLAGATTSIKTLDKTLDLAETYSQKVDRSGSPFIAKYVNFLNGKVAGDEDTTAFQGLMKTAANEYAKIMSGAASSISGATVSSIADAESIINAEMSKGQIQEVMDILRKDAQFRLSSQKDTIAGLQTDIKDIGGTSKTSGSTSGGSTYNSSQPLGWDNIPL